MLQYMKQSGRNEKVAPSISVNQRCSTCLLCSRIGSGSHHRSYDIHLLLLYCDSGNQGADGRYRCILAVINSGTSAAGRCRSSRRRRSSRQTEVMGHGDGFIATINRFKSRLKAKCALRRGESTVLFKNEHVAQARARWHVRGGRAELGRCTKNIGFS